MGQVACSCFESGDALPFDDNLGINGSSSNAGTSAIVIRANLTYGAQLDAASNGWQPGATNVEGQPGPQNTLENVVPTKLRTGQTAQDQKDGVQVHTDSGPPQAASEDNTEQSQTTLSKSPNSPSQSRDQAAGAHRGHHIHHASPCLGVTASHIPSH